jgi:hypothetical protein
LSVGAGSAVTIEVTVPGPVLSRVTGSVTLAVLGLGANRVSRLGFGTRPGQGLVAGRLVHLGPRPNLIHSLVTSSILEPGLNLLLQPGHLTGVFDLGLLPELHLLSGAITRTI